ncbi:MAG: COX15/CtaA family protein [Gammaproteobacteria bacterium]|jgi:cytochrome c oxidase assembly protein subunit 15|nr:COX15/CtaA family protein [Gammaproteobacteria bacterium]
MSASSFARLSAAVSVLALCVILLGAYVRLSDAGLGCPDWPGCYGHMVVPSADHAVAAASQAHPARPLDSGKAWKEMVHRYLAGALGLAILALAVIAWRGRHTGLPVVLPTILVGLVAFQALLGMWTVTHLVNPAIVTAHLAGGMAILSLLWWLTLRQGRPWASPASERSTAGRRWAILGLVLVTAQILLGGWTSSNYAALACTAFPTCNGGEWWPAADFAEGFQLWRPLGVDYEFGVLDNPARTAIHLAHRLGALAVATYVGLLALTVIGRAKSVMERRLGIALLTILCVQIGLGITNVVAQLPLPVAVGHNGGAALLLLSLLSLLHGATPAVASETGPAAKL